MPASRAAVSPSKAHRTRSVAEPRRSARQPRPEQLQPEPQAQQAQPEQTTSPSPWLTATEAAAYLRVSPRTLRTWQAEGQVPVVRLPGRLVRFHRDDLDEWARGLADKGRKGGRR